MSRTAGYASGRLVNEVLNRAMAGLPVFAATAMALLLAFSVAPAAESGPDQRPRLGVPATDSKLVLDGKLDEPCWNDAARTGPLKAAGAAPDQSPTEALLLRDADHLYVGLRCAALKASHAEAKPAAPAKAAEFIELLINSNGDRNSFYLIRVAKDGGGAYTSYNEHDPPWQDRTWQPPLQAKVVNAAGGWSAEIAIPFVALNKTKTLAAEIGLNIRRAALPGGNTHCWHGEFSNLGDAGILTGIPPRQTLPAPDYAKPKPDPTSSAAQWGVDVYAPPTAAQRAHFDQKRRETIELGPGSSHPGTTGQVRLELEGFLMAGDPHARGLIWDLAVDPRKGELYVLADPKRDREAPDLRVFDRQGKYVRTIMPLNPALPRASIEDLCAQTAREGGAELAVPKLYETLCGSLSLYGGWWHLPQKMILTPEGDLLLSNIYRGTVWRMRTDGSLPREGWTSVYHHGRNEPFESHDWTQDVLNVQDLRNYLPFDSLHYPYFCFDRDGSLHISAGQSSRTVKHFAYHWEVSQQEVTYQRPPPGSEPRGSYVSKCRIPQGVKMTPQGAFGGFAEPAGLAVDADHLIVADAGNNRLAVLGKDGRAVAAITHYQHQGKQLPLHSPTALAIDRDRNLYVLIGSEKRPADTQSERTLALVQRDVHDAVAKPPGSPTKLVKLAGWQRPELLAVSAPLHPEVLQIAVDTGVSPPLVWVANGSGPGRLVQLAGDNLALKADWGDDGQALSCPRQSGNQPILNIDPQDGTLYIEDDSNYRLKQYGTVYRIDQDGQVLKKWPPVFFNDQGLAATSPWWLPDHARHSRYPEEPLFIDSFFGKDGRVYRWKFGKAGIEILRFDRQGKPVPFAATGTNALFVDPLMEVNFWHDVFPGMEVDRQGNIYYAAKADVDAKLRPVSAYKAPHRQVNVYDAGGKLKTRGLLRLDCVRSIQLDDAGDMYIVHRPTERPWEKYLALSKFPAGGGPPLWSRPWAGYLGQAGVIFAPCHCITSRQHQSLDGKGYLFAAAKYSIQVIDCKTGKLVGEFGSYGNMDCQGKGSASPHPELPFGTISALSVWNDRLFAVDVLNRRIVKCRISYRSP